MAELTEQALYEAFRLGEQGQEAAEPAPDAKRVPTTGEQEQEAAEPAEGQEQDNQEAGVPAEAGEDPQEETEEPGEAKPPQTAQQRRENAARRRRAEQQAVNQAVAAAQAEERQKNEAALQDLFAKANLKDTITGKPITNLQQFHEWSAAFEQEKLSRDLKSGKLTAEGLATAIGNHPVVKQARAMIDKEQEALRIQQESQARAKIDAEVAKIHELDASISTLEDLFNAPYGKELYDMTKRGYSLSDAHYLLNREKLENARLAAARQQGMMSARGKDHMTGAASPRGGGAVSVPTADMEMFRLFNPGVSDAEIQNFYNQQLKR